MTTMIGLPLGSDKDSYNLEDKSTSENSTKSIELSSTSQVDLFPSSESSTNQNENITEEISVTGDKMPSAAEVGKSTGNPEDEAFETENQSNSSNNLFTKDESNSKSPLLKNSLLSDISKDNVLLQENKKNFPQEEKLSNTADNSNSQRENDKEDGDPSNKQNINKTTNKILDSDDDDDDDIYTSLKLNKKTLKPTTKKVFTFDSDSEDENIFTSKKQSNEETVSVSEMSESIDLAVNSVKRSRIMNIVDSDSDDESINIKEKEKSQDQIHKSGALKGLVDSDSEYANHTDESSEDENNKSIGKKKNIQKTKKMSNVLKDLVDSEESENDERNINNRAFSDDSDENKTKEKIKEKSQKKRKGSARASKDAAMQQIHSETQRLLRESEISLPYHRPKQRTLQEFLNRKKIIPLLKAPTTAAKVRMFDDIISKAVEEKEKEIEMFYKSSDSEEEMPLVNKENDKNINVQTSIDKNMDDKELERPQKEVDDVSNKNDRNLNLANLGVPDKLLSENLGNSEQEGKSVQDQDIDTKNSNVSRKLFESDNENKKDFESNNLSPKECETLTENIHESGIENNKDSDAMETDTNDFELRFSTNDFDTNWNLLGLDKNLEESVPSAETVDSKNSEVNEIELIGSSSIVENDNRIEDDQLNSARLKGHVLGLPPPDFDDDLIKKPLKKKIPPNLLNLKPRFRASPGATIDFSNDIKPSVEKVNELLDRLVRHSNVPKTQANSDVTVIHTEVTPDGLKIVEQVLPYKMMSVVDDPDLKKPGAKLQRLKEELQQKIVSKRNEEWRQKEEASKESDEDFDDEFDQKGNDDLLPDEEEELDDQSTESEPEENDIIIKEKKKSKCAFADDEAEVSDDNEENDGDDEDEERDEEEEEEEVEAKDKNDDDREDNDDDEREDDDDDEQGVADLGEHPKKLRRITTAFEDDSNHSESDNSENEISDEVKKRKNFQRTKTDVDMFGEGSDGWTSDIEDEMRPKMIEAESPACHTPPVKSDHLSLVSPITQLTALNKHLDSAKRNSVSKETDSLDRINDYLLEEPGSTEKLPQGSLASDKWCSLQKKLFQDAPDAVNDEELMNICSGNFNATGIDKKYLKPLMNLPTQKKVTESQLLDLCSGSFSSQPVESKESSDKAMNNIDENSQDIKLTFNEESRSPTKSSPKKVEEVKLLGGRFKVLSSDEEDEMPKEESKKKAKKKMKQLVLSDEEDDEEMDLSEEEVEPEEEEEKFIDYDSEENEVVIIPKNDIKKVAAKFLEEEAELSESEWGSADEDEKDLDKLEKEEGDDDDIDEDQMRNQLGKIHARQMLDDDQRDVRLLQDMLFEDGDLHSDGAGRERKFKWKNMDKLGDEWANSKAPEDQDLILDAIDDASELEFRKLRYERQKFLEEQKKDSDDIEEDLNDSQIFKLNLRVVNTKSKIVSEVEESLPNKVKKPLAPSIIPNLLENPAKDKTTTIQYAMRGSFLARGEETLARIASIIDEKDKIVRAPVNGRRFVFEHISPSVKDAEGNKTDEKVSTPSNRPRKRTSTSDSTPKSKKMKVNDERSSGKKLFGN